jgi:6-phosphogluconate dehydrogenase, C-terminal domain
MAHLSCLEALPQLGPLSRRSSRRQLPKRTASPAATGLVRRDLAIMSKWFTMVLSFTHQSSLSRSFSALGIEYGDMQLISEAYDILKRGLGFSELEIAEIFEKWNKGVLDSFLIEITANILKFKDDDGEPVLTKILDKAGQKGTGKWTAIAALESGTAGLALYLYPHSVVYP